MVYMRINVSIDDKLLKNFDDYCEKYRFNRSEFVSKLMREVVFGTPKPKREVKTEVREVQKEEIKKDELELQKQEKLSKARDLLNSLPRQSKAPLFCPKHSGSRIGENYTCGCKI